MIGALLYLSKERGIGWVINRSLYALKLKFLSVFPSADCLFEKKTNAVAQLDFFDIDTEKLTDFLKMLPEDTVKAIIRNADDCIQGRILLFSDKITDCGLPVNWHTNPITGYRYDESTKWFRIKDFSPEAGDIKAVWEISRFPHLYDLARAYLITRDEKYVRAFSKQLESWVGSNKYSYGVNYKCGQECAVRMITLLYVYPIFRKALGEKDINNISQIVHSAYRKILSNFFYAYRCQKNNHALSEIAGMIAGAWCTRDTKRLKKAYSYLEKSVAFQFRPDGGHIQDSFVYQRFALSDVQIAVSASRKTGIELSSGSKDRISRSLLMMLQLSEGNGDLSNYGSNDGSLPFILSTCGYRDFRPTVNSLYSLLHGKRLFEKGAYDEELIWNGLTDVSEVEETEKSNRFFENSGLFAFGNDNYKALFVAKKVISHSDNGHIDVWANGKNILCDCGTYSYADKTGDVLRSSFSHNTLSVNGYDQVKHFGKFAAFCQPRNVKTEFSENSASLSAQYCGYSHRRDIAFEDSSLKITDFSDAEKYTVCFYTPFCPKLENGKVKTEHFELSCNSEISLEKCFASIYYLSLNDVWRIKITGFGKTETKIVIYRE